MLAVSALAIASCSNSAPRDAAPAEDQAAVVEFFPEGSAKSFAEGSAESAVPTAPTKTVDPPRGDAADSSDDVTPAPAAAPPGSSWIVWLREGDQDATTFYLDSAGRVLRSEPGAMVAFKGHVGRIAFAPETVSTEPCASLETDDSEPEVIPDPVEPWGQATRAMLIDDTGARTTMVRVDDGAKGAAELEHAVEVVATVGPYVFLRETLYAYTCGAHGNTSVSQTIWDSVSKSTIPAPTDIGPVEGPLAEAIDILNDNGDQGFEATEESTSVSAVVPSYGDAGTLAIGLSFTSPTCCG